MFISGGGDTSFYIVMMKTEDGKPICLLIENGSPGLSFGKNEPKLGWNSQPTREVSFDNVEVPKENILGEIGQGFKIAMEGLDGG